MAARRNPLKELHGLMPNHFEVPGEYFITLAKIFTYYKTAVHINKQTNDI